MTAPDRATLEGRTALALFLAAAAASLAAAGFGWSHAISDWYGWRQTQTAISALFMLRGGPWLDYELPVFGPPWQIPHEFPLYQAAVVTLARLSGLPLEGAGRAVSLAFFYGAVAAGHALLGDLGLPSRRRLLVLVPWLLSPLYLFWSRTFMIESTALCLCLVFLLFAGRFFRGGRPVHAAAALLAGCLGAAVKPPTVVVPAALAGLWWLLTAARSPGRRLSSRTLAGALTVVLPLVAGWAWQQHAESRKARNPFASGISSNQLLQEWVLDPVGRRIQPEAWTPLWEQGVPLSVGHPLVLAAAAAAVVLARRRRALFALALAGFVAHFVAFMPLDSEFHYYWYGAGVFLAAAVGIAAVALLECDDRRRPLGWLLVALAAAGGVHGYATRMLPFQRQDAYRKPDWTVRLARAVSAATRPGDVIVGFGMNWNPELPYYAARRALMWPAWSDARPGSADVAAMLAGLRGHTVGAVFDCRGSAPAATLALVRERWGLTESPTFRARCALYVRPAAAVAPAVR